MHTTGESSRNQVVIRRLVLFGVPLLLCILELGHPLLDHMHTISMLAPIATWWIALHVLLIPLFALMGWAIYLLLRGLQGLAATISRCTTVIFIVFEVGYDTSVGLNSGILASNASVLPSAQQGVIQQALNQLFANPAIVLSYYILFASGVVAICSAAWALYRAGVPSLPLIILLGTLLSTYSHALPFGPLGSACFFLAALWIELVWRSSPHREHEVQGASPVVEQLNVQ